MSRTLVAHLLSEMGYRLQGNRKTTAGESQPDRDAQFGDLNTQVAVALPEPRIAAYLSSRRIAFNEHAIFRHYPELDTAL